MALEDEIAAAKLLVSIAKVENSIVEPWIERLSKETPDEFPAFSLSRPARKGVKRYIISPKK
jgi:hypothetical protein